ncbi:DNA polymerase IV [Bacillus safensis FO-36b] [Bacillus safensis subsp. safensis]
MDKNGSKLKKIGIHTIEDLAKANEYTLKELLGINGPRLKQKNGEHDGIVDPERIYEFKSVGNSSTLPHDSDDSDELVTLIDKLSQSVSARLRRKEVMANRLLIMIRYASWKNITRSAHVTNPTDRKEDIFEAAKQLFLKHWNDQPVRLLGVTGTDLVERKAAVKQLDLFSYTEDAKEEPLQTILDGLKEKYGKSLVQRGVTIKEKESKTSGTSFNKDFFQDEEEMTSLKT